MNPFRLIALLILFPATGTGQVSCADEQIKVLQLNMIATSVFSRGSIIIDCDSIGMQLSLTTYDTSDEIIESERHPLPSLLYKEFKAAVLPLEIKSMTDLSNLYLYDGLETEIIFQDRYGNSNRFETRVPVVRGRNLYLIETIISLTKELPISDDHQLYLESLYDNFLIYCRE